MTVSANLALIVRMDYRRKSRIAALKARLEICEEERRKLLSILTTTGANLGKISWRAEELEKEYRRLTNELKILDIADPEDES
ncbi:hypothetical protein [Occallatibacter savannae]|uniref:hypothetical protein n=1 Tax=Occallatibacter savannae TaxID=1002691 RepID=UPI000D68D9B4|nr:hypothetical protein [Occallatibacter savannae]